MELNGRLKAALAEAASYPNGYPQAWRIASMNKLEALGLVKQGKGKSAAGFGIDMWFLTDAGKEAAKPLLEARKPRYFGPIISAT